MDKFPMKLVIDAVTTPLLHARLSQARTPRQRAALLRSIAESALRFPQGSPTQAEHVRAGSGGVPPEAQSFEGNGNEARLQTGGSGNATHFDPSEIADQFAAFL